LTLVALDENKRPVTAPPLVPETAEERRRCENAERRVQRRKQQLQQHADTDRS
jgi:acyl-CoA hydrolase